MECRTNSENGVLNTPYEYTNASVTPSLDLTGCKVLMRLVLLGVTEALGVFLGAFIVSI